MISELKLAEITFRINRYPDIYCIYPQNDGTVLGTAAAIEKDEFKIEKVGFEPGDTFVDLGSNCGLLSCLIAKLYPLVQVYSFDVSPLACACLRHNYITNKLHNIQVYNVGIGEVNKKTHFAHDENNITCATQLDLSANKQNVQNYSVISIDEIFESKILGIDRIKYLKMDIEGSEFEVLNHLINKSPHFLNKVDYWHLEIHDYSGAEELRKKVKNLLGDKLLS